MGNGGTFWQRLGKAFKNDQTGMITVHLNAYPLPDKEGKVKIMLFEEQESDRKDQGNATRPAPRQGPQRTVAEDLDDEIPF